MNRFSRVGAFGLLVAASYAFGGDVPLIPRATMFGNLDRAGAQLSPDGKWISYLAPVENVMNVWVAPSDDMSKAQAITRESTGNPSMKRHKGLNRAHAKTMQWLRLRIVTG